MTYEEFKKQLYDLQKKYDEERKEMIREFSLSLAEFKEGDILESNHGNRIIVHKIIPTYNLGIPDYYYYGLKLRKDYTPFKSGETDTIHSHHKITKINLNATQ